MQPRWLLTPTNGAPRRIDPVTYRVGGMRRGGPLGNSAPCFEGVAQGELAKEALEAFFRTQESRNVDWLQIVDRDDNVLVHINYYAADPEAVVAPAVAYEIRLL